VSVDAAAAMRVLIIAGVRLYGEGLAAVLGARPSVEIVGVVTDPESDLEEELARRPDVVLIDTSMPGAITLIRTILTTAAAAKVIALGLSEDDHTVIAFAEAGVVGYVTRDSSVGHLLAVMDTVGSGDVACPPRLAARLLRHISVLAAREAGVRQDARLTHRELEVVDLIDRGLSNKEIARRLCIAVPTVKNHVHRILDKLELKGRADAAAWARANETQSMMRLRAPSKSAFSRGNSSG
jgi:two-component system, NarL family, nitrate/nitrite response regulator NarL